MRRHSSTRRASAQPAKSPNLRYKIYDKKHARFLYGVRRLICFHIVKMPVAFTLVKRRCESASGSSKCAFDGTTCARPSIGGRQPTARASSRFACSAASTGVVSAESNTKGALFRREHDECKCRRQQANVDQVRNATRTTSSRRRADNRLLAAQSSQCAKRRFRSFRIVDIKRRQPETIGNERRFALRKKFAP